MSEKRPMPSAEALSPSAHETPAAPIEAVERCIEQSQRLVTLGTLAAGVAHEINNILTPVLSYAHMAKSQRHDAALQIKALNKIIAGVKAACAVAQGTLEYSQNREEDDVALVSEVLDAAIGCMAREPEKDGITVVRKIQPEVSVRMRPLALQQVFLNLLLNARSAMNGRRGTVTVEVTSASNGMTTILFSDDGPGIPADLIERLFEPFVSTRTNQALFKKNTVGGAGLGLTVSRHLVERARGSIVVRSRLGKGATFTITIPTAQAVTVKAAG